MHMNNNTIKIAQAVLTLMAVLFLGCSGESNQDTIKFAITVQGGETQLFGGTLQINGDSPSNFKNSGNPTSSVCYYDKEITSDDYTEEKLETVDITVTPVKDPVGQITNYPTTNIKIYRVDNSGNVKKVKETSSSSSQVSLSYKYDEENSSSSSDSSSSKSSSSSSSE